MPPTRGKIMIPMYDYTACMDYMNLDVCLQKKAVELNHSLTRKYKDIITLFIKAPHVKKNPGAVSASG